jgi:hypothetical protein
MSAPVWIIELWQWMPCQFLGIFKWYLMSPPPKTLSAVLNKIREELVTLSVTHALKFHYELR